MEKHCKVLGAFSHKVMKRRKGKRPSLLLVAAIKAVVSIDHTIIDLGAGEGRHVNVLKKEGYQVIGVDGTEGVEEITGGLIQWADLTNCPELFHIADWGLFIDVGEHVPKEMEEKLFNSVSKIPKFGLVVTWGLPGQSGRGHVNCKPSEYVTIEFCKRGWKLDEKDTILARKMTNRQHNNRILVFKRAP